MNRMTYFDHAAATPLSKTVLSAMQPYFSEHFYNPSALYLAAQEVKAAVSTARQQVASVLGAKSSEIIFTAGGTESDNLAIRGVMEAFPGSNCVVSAIEHDAVLAPADRYVHKISPVLSDGRIEVNKLIGLVDDDTVLISVMYANNELGTVQPLRDISERIKAVLQDRKARGVSLPLYLHTDACQAANYLPLLVHTLGVDLMTLNGGKIYGPKQAGVLFVRTGVNLSSQILGGGQERGLRSGTENVPSLIGFAAALSETHRLRESEVKRLSALQEYVFSRLKTDCPKVIINGHLQHRLVNNVHLSVPGSDNERLMMELDERGIMVATGSACSASSDEPSHVLRAIGLSDEDARSSLRITFGRSTTRENIDMLVDSLVELVA